MYARSKSTWHVLHPEQPVGEYAGVYLFPNGVYAVPYSGDITKATADAVVTEEPADLNPTNFVSRALLWKSGKQYQLDRQDLIKSYGGLKYGQVYETRAGTGLNFFYAFHAIVTSFQEGREKEWMRCTHDLYRNILKRADDKLATTLAMPLIGTGSAAAPTHYAIDALIQCMANISPQFLKKVFIISIDPNVTDKVKQACINFVHQISYRATLNQPVTISRNVKLQSGRIAYAKKEEDRDGVSLTSSGAAVLKPARRNSDEVEINASQKNCSEVGSKARVTFRDDVQSPDSDWSRPLRTLREKRLARSYNSSEFRNATNAHIDDKFKEIPFNAVGRALSRSLTDRVKLSKTENMTSDLQSRNKPRIDTPHTTENTKHGDMTSYSKQTPPYKPGEDDSRDTPDHAWDDPESDDSPARLSSRSRRHKSSTSISRSNKSVLYPGRTNKLRTSRQFSETRLENPERYIDMDACCKSNDHHRTARTKETKSGPSRSIRLKSTRHTRGKINLRGYDLTDRSRWETMQPKAKQKRPSLTERHVWLKEAVIVDTARDSDEWDSISDSGNETDDEIT